jgi:hypothetical protein
MGGGGEGEGEEVKYKPMKAGEYVLERLRATRALEEEGKGEGEGEGEGGELDAWIVGSREDSRTEDSLKPLERCQLLSR